MTLDFTARVAVVTGAGGGLGRAHALAARGAHVLVNDVGGAVNGSDAGSTPAERVAAEITDAGGDAVADSTDVTDPGGVEAMIERTVDRWGRIDILINNAGILRDRTFGKLTLDDFRSVLEVHLMGSVHTSRAVWPHMAEQNYGRILMTTPSPASTATSARPTTPPPRARSSVSPTSWRSREREGTSGSTPSPRPPRRA